MIAGLVRASGLGGRKVRTPLHASEGVALRLRHEGEPFEPAALRAKGNAPGNARGAVAQTSVCAFSAARILASRAQGKNHRLKPVLRFTDSATENRPPAVRYPVIARRKTFGMSSWFARR